MALIDLESTSPSPPDPATTVDEPFVPDVYALAARRFYEDLEGSVRGTPGRPAEERRAPSVVAEVTTSQDTSPKSESEGDYAPGHGWTPRDELHFQRGQL